MYKIKEKPEDFVVHEERRIELDDSGDFVYFTLVKKGFNTMNVVEKIAGFLHVPVKNVGFAGAKDKQAVTTQTISIKDPSKSISAERFDKFNGENIKLEYLGRGKNPVSLGDLSGNKFEIMLRECEKAPAQIDNIVNYFDDQRFSDTNADVGRAIVKKEFKKAVSLVSDDRVSAALQENPTEPIAALKKLPLKIRMLHVHAYQSLLWNKMVSERIGDTGRKISYSQGELNIPDSCVENERIELIGFGTELDDAGRKVLASEGITTRDFVIKSMPEISAEGGGRDMIVPIKDLVIEEKGDKKYLVKFTLPKGSYATMSVKQMFC